MLIDTKFRREVVVAGERVELRCITGADKDALNRFFHGLCADTRYKRFLGYLGELSEPMLRYLTEVDLDEHTAIVAIGESGAIIGVTRMVRMNKRERAEMAIVVADAHQGRGLGGVLVRTLAEAAHERGVTTFVAHALSDNIGIRRSLAHVGALTSDRHDAIVVALRPPATTELRLGREEAARSLPPPSLPH